MLQTEILLIILLNMYNLNPVQTWIAFGNNEVKFFQVQVLCKRMFSSDRQTMIIKHIFKVIILEKKFSFYMDYSVSGLL